MYYSSTNSITKLLLNDSIRSELASSWYTNLLVETRYWYIQSNRGVRVLMIQNLYLDLLGKNQGHLHNELRKASWTYNSWVCLKATES